MGDFDLVSLDQVLANFDDGDLQVLCLLDALRHEGAHVLRLEGVIGDPEVVMQPLVQHLESLLLGLGLVLRKDRCLE